MYRSSPTSSITHRTAGEVTTRQNCELLASAWFLLSASTRMPDESQNVVRVRSAITGLTPGATADGSSLGSFTGQASRLAACLRPRSSARLAG